jgi:hypothetical protein
MAANSTYRLGAVAHGPVWDVAVTACDAWPPLAPSSAAEPDGESLLVVWYRLTNAAGRPVAFAEETLALEDALGRTWAPNAAASGVLARALGVDPTAPLLVGATEERALAFAVPADAAGLVLRSSGGYLAVDLGR